MPSWVLGVIIPALPDGDTPRDVLHAEDVADGVVGVGLEVVPLGLGVLGMGDRREARRSGLGEAVVLAAGGAYFSAVVRQS